MPSGDSSNAINFGTRILNAVTPVTSIMARHNCAHFWSHSRGVR